MIRKSTSCVRASPTAEKVRVSRAREQRRLQLQRELGHLVEEERAAVRLLERAGASFTAPVKAPRT